MPIIWCFLTWVANNTTKVIYVISIFISLPSHPLIFALLHCCSTTTATTCFPIFIYFLIFWAACKTKYYESNSYGEILVFHSHFPLCFPFYTIKYWIDKSFFLKILYNKESGIVYVCIIPSTYCYACLCTTQTSTSLFLYTHQEIPIVEHFLVSLYYENEYHTFIWCRSWVDHQSSNMWLEKGF